TPRGARLLLRALRVDRPEAAQVDDAMGGTVGIGFDDVEGGPGDRICEAPRERCCHRSPPPPRDPPGKCNASRRTASLIVGSAQPYAASVPEHPHRYRGRGSCDPKTR